LLDDISKDLWPRVKNSRIRIEVFKRYEWNNI
jgi:hypothetical protein